MRSALEIHPEKVAIYIRWSTDDQGEGTTLQTQWERCRHYLASQGWAYREGLVYIDDGYSGGSLDRPALARLRADVAAGLVECVVVYKIDRLSRSVVDIVDLVLREWEGRCFVKSTTEEVNTISPAGKMFFYILVSFAEYERNVIRERTMGGKVKRAEQGLNPGFRPPYGYKKGAAPGTVELVEHEASVVRRIFDLYLKGIGPGQIAEHLNRESICRRGRLWNPLMVRRLLANPAYMGVLEYGRTQRTSKEQQSRKRTGSLIRYEQPRFARVEGAFPAIVEGETWERAQRLRRDRNARQQSLQSRPSYSPYLLSGVAVCRCGAAIAGKRSGEHRYYCCSGRKRYGRSACDAGHIPLEAVHEAIGNRLRALLATGGGHVGLEGLEQELAGRIGEGKAALEQERMALTAIAERRKRLESDYRAGELPARLYAQELEALDREEGEGQARQGRLQERLAHLGQVLRDREALAQALRAVNIWDDLRWPERKALLQKLTASVRLYRPAHTGEPPWLRVEWIRLD